MKDLLITLLILLSLLFLVLGLKVQQDTRTIILQHSKDLELQFHWLENLNHSVTALEKRLEKLDD